jgi:hypothetical protein
MILATKGMPAPLTPDELLARADLAGRARVVSVHRLEDQSGRIATLKFYGVAKGRPIVRRPRMLAWLPWGRTVVVRMRSAKRGPDGRPLPGEWSDGYRKGDMVMTHLAWDPDAQAYSTIWWNAVWLAPHPK